MKWITKDDNRISKVEPVLLDFDGLLIGIAFELHHHPALYWRPVLRSRPDSRMPRIRRHNETGQRPTVARPVVLNQALYGSMRR
jgi:hypothetical protein